MNPQTSVQYWRIGNFVETRRIQIEVDEEHFGQYNGDSVKYLTYMEFFAFAILKQIFFGEKRKFRLNFKITKLILAPIP